MMKLVVFAFAAICLVGSTTATSEPIPAFERQQFTEWLLDILPEGVIHPAIYKRAKEFNYEEALTVWNDTEALTKFWNKYQYGMFERDGIFSFNDPIHIEEVKLFFYALKSAPTEEYFFTFAAWAHVHLNQAMFANGFIVTITHREDINIKLPPPNQMFRNFFYPAETLKMFEDYRYILHTPYKNQSTWYVPIWANFTSSYARDDSGDFKLDYFHNDITSNIYYYLFYVMQPFWMHSDEYVNSTTRGMHWLSYHTALVNRLSMEYVSHGLKPLRYFTWRHPNIPSYMPSMVYENGVPLTQRDNLPYESSVFAKYSDEIIKLEQMIYESIAVKHLISPEGKQLVVDNSISSIGLYAGVVEGHFDSVNFELYQSYERLGKKVLGFSDRRGNDWEQFPNSLENPSTAMRDPAFYMFYMKIVEYFNGLKKQLPAHPQNELEDNNLVITKFKVDEILTYIEPYNSTMFNVSVHHDESYLIKARQMRLNHKPFHFFVNVRSIEIVKIAIRIFMGPAYKYPSMLSFDDYSRFYMVYFNTQDLVVGNNKLELSSSDNLVGGRDFEEPLSADDLKNPLFTVFPRNVIFPRGNSGGMPVRYYVFIEKYVPDTKPQLLYSWPNALRGDKPLEYPFDRRIENMTMPNMAEYYGKIFYKKDYNAELFF